MVDIHSTRYAIARRYMIRLRRDDFEDAARAGQVRGHRRPPLEEFRQEFEYLVEDEPPALVVSLGEAGGGSRSNPRS